jgi:hypothetical protein
MTPVTVPTRSVSPAASVSNHLFVNFSRHIAGRRWQRLKPTEKLARMLLDHLEGILNYCRTNGRD